ncbi:hypothetical protein UA08_06390 [Talaromyces atroroseus]|uniref:Oxidoreductase n=1 Tax=Talaromyces atroroseus TaxID=1441469 RepID=A0A225AIZ5_TALAT|nr:hypothetical protein UA08_06390 [Talaromyces atroroseus]OKL58234.1 hypothetical protein UA08_06390 [Talaromyces atroroseus]
MPTPPIPFDSSTVWLITGSSSGLGKSIAQTAYNAGHQVVATARNTRTLSYLPDDSRVLKLGLDVTSRKSIVSAIQSSVDRFGHLDVVVNNAGYTHMGDTEVISEADSRLLLETLFWGPVSIMQEAVRVFRDINPGRRGGTIVNVSSMGGSMTVPGNSFYHAGKFALEGFAKSMSQEMEPEWNIRFLIIAPGSIRTNFINALKVEPRHPAYDNPSNPTTQILNHVKNAATRGIISEPDICAKLLFDTVVGRYDRPFPKRILMGSDAYHAVKHEIDTTLHEIESWKIECESCSPNRDTDVAQT